jgi:hypothetical protein
MIKLTTQNANQVGNELADLYRDFHGKAAKAGMREVGKILSKDLRSRVGSKSGALRRSITTKVMTRQVKRWYGVGAKQAAMEVGALRKVQDASGRKRNQLYKFRWQEAGTQRHMIRAWNREGRLTRGQVRALNKRGQTLKRSVVHPGQRANSLLSRVIAGNEGRADAQFTQGVGKLLKKYGVSVS